MLLLLRVVFEQQQRRAGDGVGEVRVKARFVRRVEEGEEPVVILLRDGIELVVVATGALHRHPEERAGQGVDAVGVVLDAEFLLHAAALVGLAMQPVERRGETLLSRRVRQQVAGDLPEDEIVDAHVAVEGADDPVTPGPEMVEPVGLIAVGVRIARDVEPVDGHAFTVGRRGEQSIHEPLISLRRAVADVSVNFFDRGWKADQIERQPANKMFPVGLGRRLQSLALQPGKHKTVDVVVRPLRVVHTRERHVADRNERPMFLPLGALLDPAAGDGQREPVGVEPVLRAERAGHADLPNRAGAGWRFRPGFWHSR